MSKIKTSLINTYKFTVNLIVYLMFIRKYLIAQMKFNLSAFYHIVVEGKRLSVIDSNEELLSVNNYHTRYEGTERSA